MGGGDGPAIEGGERPGLRERKAAATRLAIVESLRRRLTDTALADITVEQLAGDANVSRMTFFNYFPSKEHAVDLLMVHWMVRIEAELRKGRLRGVAAIDRIFALTGDEVAAAPLRMRRIDAYFGSRPEERPLPQLTAADRLALAPDGSAADVGPEGLGRLFIRLCEEAAEDGDLEIHGSSYELAHFLGAVLHGAAAIGHSAADTDWRRLYRRHGRRALGLLGAKGFEDPPPARVPASYRRGKR